MTNVLDVVKHHFIGGLYCKHMVIPEDHTVVSHKHNFDHMSILVSGCVIVEVDGEQSTHYSPAVINIQAGKAHSVTPVNGPAVWMCIHNVDELGDVDSLTVDGKLIMDDDMVAPA